ncbi:ER6L2 protein, partial [Polypterus senegalus]
MSPAKVKFAPNSRKGIIDIEVFLHSPAGYHGGRQGMLQGATRIYIFTIAQKDYLVMRIEEIRAIPGCLGSLNWFKSNFSDPIENGQRHNVTKRGLALGRRAVYKLAKKISCWFLRRTKFLISSQLPKKDDRTNKDGIPVHTLCLSYLTVLRKVANHVALLQPKEGVSEMQVKCIKGVCMQVFSKFPEFVKQSDHSAFEIISDPKYSGKMKLLDVIEQFCMAEGIEYRRLDGNTKSNERITLVKEFNTSHDINICLVSTMAGGLGLNFVGANIVVLFDPTWNPASDLQAIDRAYRIGQCRDVKVFRLISLGTVEEIIYLRQVYKQQLQCAVIGRENAKRYFDAVQGSDGHRGELFGIKNLFQFSTNGTCLTRNILQNFSEQPAKPHTTKHISQEITSSTELVHLEHPVINNERKVHRSGRTTFLIGETPLAIRRKHLSEMTAYFKKSSVKQLAEQILTTTSESRQRYYNGAEEYKSTIHHARFEATGRDNQGL